MNQEIRIDITQMVGKIAAVLFQPYVQFIAKLHEEGRVSTTEIQGVNEQYDERVANLPDYVQKAMDVREESAP